MNMAILISAAGNSSRLGEPKQLVEFHGKPLLQHCIDLCASMGPDVYCVLGAYATKIRSKVAHQHCRFLYNPTWQDGLSNSIAFGVSHLPEDTTDIMVMLCDLWSLNVDELCHLIEQHRQAPKKIHSGFYDNHLGAPTIFPQTCFAELKALPPGLNGAKQVIKAHLDEVVPVAMPSAANDLDTPIQLQQLQALELSYGHSFN